MPSTAAAVNASTTTGHPASMEDAWTMALAPVVERLVVVVVEGKVQVSSSHIRRQESTGATMDPLLTGPK